MFRKKRASSNPPVQSQPTTPSATSAAALAFLTKRASDANLSSAAAAAALRSHTASPEPVGSIQTKRMVRRGSTSSIGSATGSARQPFSTGVQRNGSSASLSSRTFRSPSPGGRNLASHVTKPSDVPPIPTKSHRRNPSAESSQRIASPRPYQLSVATNGPSQPPATTVRYDPNTRTLIRVPVQPNPQQPSSPGSPRSINFSRPMSPPVTYNAKVREPLKARPASSQGFRTTETQRAIPSGTLTARSQAQSTARPSSSAEVVPALLAASTAARISPATPAAQATSAASLNKKTLTGTTAATVPNPQRSMATTEATTSSSPKSSALPTQIKSTAQSTPIPAPSQDQIKAFQTRAASMLARPRSDAAATAAANPPAKAVNEGPASPRPNQQQITATPTTASQPTKTSTPMLHLTTATTEVGKSSHSPTRSAHFSESPLLDNVKHQPPPRALSPAKSALKAPSPRPSSPASSTGKAMSDTSEPQSEEGNLSTQKKKKVVRVSFDEQAVLVGQATTPQTPINTLASPQYRKGTGDSWPTVEEQDYAPRPTLPSFGSIRGRKSPSTPEPEQFPKTPVREPNLSTSDASPATPELSDDLSGAKSTVAFHSSEPGAVSSDARGETAPSETIPAISVLPATPRLDEETKEFINAIDAVQPAVAVDDATSVTDFADSGTSDLSNPPTSSAEVVPPVDTFESKPEQADAESDENVEVFADAAEVYDVEEDKDTRAPHAFGEASAMDSTPHTIPEDPDEGSTADSKENENLAANIPTSTAGETEAAGSTGEGEDWERIRKYWNSLSEDRKQQLEQEATGSNQNAVNDEKQNSGAAFIQQAPLPPWPDREYQKSSTEKPASFPQSLRAGHERTGSGNSPMKTTLRDNARPLSSRTESKPAMISNPRPKSAVVTSTAASSASTAVLSSQSAGRKKEVIRPSLERTLSNDSSASESSFRRRRRGSVTSSDGGGISLRRTMRGSKDAEAASSLSSPTKQRGMHSPSPSLTQPPRTSLRAKGDSSGQSLRTRNLRGSEQGSTTKTSMFGLSKPSKPSGASARGGSKFRSRFDDSSDEEADGGKSHFVSRFDDSDDSDAENNLAKPTAASPTSPTARKSKQLASPQSSNTAVGGNMPRSLRDEKKTKSILKGGSNRPSTPPNANGVLQGTALHSGTLRGSHEDSSAQSSPAVRPASKRGFWGFGKRNTAQTLSKSNTEPAVGPVANSNSPRVATEAASHQNNATASTRPKSSFFRRMSAAGSTGRLPIKEDFPHPPPPIPNSVVQTPVVERPNTSDGVSSMAVATPTRPPLGNKRDSAMTAPLEQSSPIVSERTGKKKKFQGLRRLLRVQD